MKRFLTCFIVVMILGISMFSSKVIAEDAIGTCTVHVVVGSNRVTQGVTKAQCDRAAGTWASTSLSSTPLTGCPEGEILDLQNHCISKNDYVFLAPINPEGGEGTGATFDPTEEHALSNYLNMMIKLIIGLSAVMAVMMFVIGGIEYMTSELVHSKESAKSRMTGAITGLIIALGAYALLNTINPDLLKTDLEIKGATLEVTLDQNNFSRTEQSVAIAGTSFRTAGSASTGVAEFVQNKLANQSIRTITVDTQARKAYFYVGAEGDWSQYVAVPINVGQGGVAGAGTAQAGDGKTPIGSYIISGDRRIGSNGNAVISGNGYNLGAAFINIGIKDAQGNDRGIGFHGSVNDSLGATNGCVRMSNDDLLALAPYMKSGVRVIIK